MKGVILAGGFGTRLRPLTYNIPKPMVPVVNVPIMEHNLRLLKKHGIKDLIVILYYQGDTIKDYFKDGSQWGVKITYHKADSDYGTAGALKDASSLIGKDDFIIISADILTDFDIKKGIAAFNSRRSLFTIFLTSVSNPLDFGIVIFDEKSTITKFLEKPSWGQVFSDQINTGIYVVKNKVLDYIPEKTFFDFSKDLFPAMMDDGKSIKAHVAKGYWRDIGNISEYRNAHRDILKGQVKVSISGKRLDILGQDVRCGQDVQVGKNIEFSGTVIIGNNSFIGNNCHIENTVIGSGVTISSGVVIKNSIVWDNSAIGKRCRIHENIIGSAVTLGDNCYISENAVVSDNCILGQDVVVNSNVKIWPQKTIEEGSIIDKSVVWGGKWNKNLFGNYGITGIANSEIHPEFAAKIGAVYGATLGKGSKILIGRDAHKASRMISRAFITGLLSVGVNIDHLSEVALPILRFQLNKGAYKGGVFIRMSPIDAQLMDIQFYDESGFDVAVGFEKSIERLFHREDYLRMNYREVGNISYPYRVYEYYKEGWENFVDGGGENKKLSVVIDYASGLTSKTFPTLIGQITKNTTSLNAALDEEREAYTPEEYKFHLSQLREIVKNLNMDLGFLIDSCGESIAVIDEKGHCYENEKLLILLSFLLLKYQGLKRMILPVNAPKFINDLAATHKCTVITSPVTLKFLGKQAQEAEVDFVGTVNGEFMFPSFSHAVDGICSISKIITLVSKHDLKLSQVWKDIGYKRKFQKTRVPCSDKFKGRVLRELYENFKDGDIEMIDGISIRHSKNVWMTIIPDSDAACFNISGEYVKKEEWDKYLQKVKKIIRQVTG
ncbi:NTP transferase domain-containing protein [bacterium]|nr:NTP transferase domain-containing protein [bacterium]